MDRSVEEARKLLQEEEARLRRLRYEELVALQSPVVKDVLGPSGQTYSMEILAAWDDRRKKALRVMIDVQAWWGSGISQPKELMTAFIIAPDGTFVGEDLDERQVAVAMLRARLALLSAIWAAIAIPTAYAWSDASAAVRLVLGVLLGPVSLVVLWMIWKLRRLRREMTP